MDLLMRAAGDLLSCMCTGGKTQAAPAQAVMGHYHGVAGGGAGAAFGGGVDRGASAALPDAVACTAADSVLPRHGRPLHQQRLSFAALAGA